VIDVPAVVRNDEPRGALLLERLGRPLEALGLRLPTGAHKGRWLVEFIVSSWRGLDHPCSERAIDRQMLDVADRVTDL